MCDDGFWRKTKVAKTPWWKVLSHQRRRPSKPGIIILYLPNYKATGSTWSSNRIRFTPLRGIMEVRIRYLVQSWSESQNTGRLYGCDVVGDSVNFCFLCPLPRVQWTTKLSVELSQGQRFLQAHALIEQCGIGDLVWVGVVLRLREWENRE